MERFQFAIILLSALALSGCASQPSSCGAVPPAKLSECVYTDAVMHQDPFSCYSIPDLNQRAKCLKDASDPAARTQLQHALPEQREPIFTAPESPPVSKANATAKPAPESPVSKADSYCHDKYPGSYDIGDTECNITEADCPCWDATDSLCLPQKACE
jgi:hypothetical protein